MNNRFPRNDYRGAFKTNSYPKAPDLGLQSLRSYQSRQAVPARQSASAKITGPTGIVAGGAASRSIVNRLMGK